jgi:opacity protein-like surface antigen
MAVTTYHGYFAYNFGPADSPVRPYVLGGIGATSYASVPFTFAGVSRETGGDTQFSTTWGAGVKFVPSRGIGVRAGVQWTPTYIKSDAVGWWCDPFWGCYVVGDAQYANQFSFNGGVIFRF